MSLAIKKQKYLVILSGIFLFYNPLYSQIVENITVEFTRIITKDNSRETTNGKIYYQVSSKELVLKVREPIIQWMIFQGETLLIYYPDERKAFRFISRNPIALPFFQVLVGIIKDDLKLMSSGFKLIRNEIKDDTLFTYWEPQKEVKNTMGKAIMNFVKDKLVSLTLHNTKGEILMRTAYNNHFQYGAIFFPLEINSIYYQESGFTAEKVVYTNPKFNLVFPQEVTNFKIPVDAEVKEIEW